MKIGQQWKNVTARSFDEKRIEARAESVVETENVTDAALAASRALQPEAKSAFQMFMVVMEECCAVEEIFFNEAKTLYELQCDSVLHPTVSLMPPDAPCSTCSARNQTSATHDVFCNAKNEHAVRFMSIVTFSGAYGHNMREYRKFSHSVASVGT